MASPNLHRRVHGYNPDTSYTSSSSSNSSYSSRDSGSTAPTSHRSSKSPTTLRYTSRKDPAMAPVVTYTAAQQHHTQEQHLSSPPPPPPPAPERELTRPDISSSSINTYDSAFSDETDEDLADEEPGPLSNNAANDFHDDDLYDPDHNVFLPPSTGDAIPPVLPPYRAAIPDPSIRPSTPEAFGQLFPSLDRLSVRHDEFTADGNMNLRIDTIAHPAPSGSGRQRRPFAVQLFHLRMHDLARRDFSLRRYCRQSGREVCNSKRAYAAPSAGPVSSALRSVTTPFQRSSAVTTSPEPDTSSTSSNTAPSGFWSSSRRPSVSSFSSSDRSTPGSGPGAGAGTVPHLVPTQTIKLEFSNYARVDVTRRKKGYAFEWWGHTYIWKRVVDTNVEGQPVSFHLYRDRHGPAVAHIVPETRSPSQVEAEESAGGWIPPCFMWISDKSIVNAVTDVADVIVATGLIALVDDSIKARWQIKKKPGHNNHHHIRRPASSHGDDLLSSSSGLSGRSIMKGIFNRRHSEQHQRSPLRFGHVVAAC